MVASTGPEMEQEQDTTTWVIVACGIYIYWLCCRRPCFTIHPSLNPHPCTHVSVSNCVACLNPLCTHLFRVPGGEEGAGPQLADDLVAELGAGVAAVGG